MVLDEYVDTLLGGFRDQGLMLLKELNGWLCEQDMDPALNGIKGDGVVSRIRGKDSDGITRLQLVNCSLIGIRVLLVVRRERVE